MVPRDAALSLQPDTRKDCKHTVSCHSKMESTQGKEQMKGDCESDYSKREQGTDNLLVPNAACQDKYMYLIFKKVSWRQLKFMVES